MAQVHFWHLAEFSWWRKDSSHKGAMCSFRGKPMFHASHRSLVMILGLAGIAVADDTKVPEKPSTAEERHHWAFQPLTRPQVPAVKNSDWLKNPIDSFVMERL